MQLGPAEILVVLVIALLIFGPNKLPEVGRQVGHAYRELRRFQRSITSEMSDVFADDVSHGAAPAPSLPPKPDENKPGVTEPDAPPAPAIPGTDEPEAEPGDRPLGDEKAET